MKKNEVFEANPFSPKDDHDICYTMIDDQVSDNFYELGSNTASDDHPKELIVDLLVLKKIFLTN